MTKPLVSVGALVLAQAVRPSFTRTAPSPMQLRPPPPHADHRRPLPKPVPLQLGLPASRARSITGRGSPCAELGEARPGRQSLRLLAVLGRQQGAGVRRGWGRAGARGEGHHDQVRCTWSSSAALFSTRCSHVATGVTARRVNATAVPGQDVALPRLRN